MAMHASISNNWPGYLIYWR